MTKLWETRSRRSQAGLEFLMTYGWAFLVMTLVITGLVSLDPLGEGPTIQRCSTTGLTACDSDKVYASEEARALIVPFQNNQAEAMTVADITLTRVNERNTSAPCTDRDRTLRSGEVAEIVCHADNLSFVDGQANTFSVSYQTYKASTGSEYARGGSLVGDVTLNIQQPPGPSLTSPDNIDEVLNSLSGSGTKENPYRIGSAIDLKAIEADKDAHYIIVDDIDASRTRFWNNESGFSPISTFKGILDGQNHSITGLYIKKDKSSSTGLIAYHKGTTANISF